MDRKEFIKGVFAGTATVSISQLEALLHILKGGTFEVCEPKRPGMFCNCTLSYHCRHYPECGRFYAKVS